MPIISATNVSPVMGKGLGGTISLNCAEATRRIVPDRMKTSWASRRDIRLSPAMVGSMVSMMVSYGVAKSIFLSLFLCCRTGGCAYDFGKKIQQMRRIKHAPNIGKVAAKTKPVMPHRRRLDICSDSAAYRRRHWPNGSYTYPSSC